MDLGSGINAQLRIENGKTNAANKAEEGMDHPQRVRHPLTADVRLKRKTP
jgi:hypothetical protein